MQIERLGPYRIGRKLGKGGMGAVFEAVDETTGQRVAVKALSPQLAAAEGFRERFESEIESLKKLQHEGIVRLYGYGEDEGMLFYSMELVDGPSLEQELGAGRRFHWRETLSIAVQICRALKHAHDHGVVHRDVKPANLLLTSDERVKIADFGIARLFGGTQLTTVGGILGTADYMSPEQVDGGAVTDKCDQYALGCVMFALLTGRPPFRANTMAEMLQLQRFADPEPVRRFAPQTPEQLDRLIGQLLSKDPNQRFPNVLVLGRHMEAMLKALSRPANKEAADDGKSPLPRGPIEATAALSPDATLAPIEPLARLETTDSDVYVAATLADGATPVAGSSSNQGSVAVAARKTESETALREKRFTTVDEDRARLARREPSERWWLGLQLAAIAAALVLLAGFGWLLTRPASADALYADITASVEEDEVEGLRSSADDIADFLQRFPDDPRSGEIRTLAEEVELQKLDRQLRVRTRLFPGKSLHPAATVYADALAIQDTDPARAVAMLDDLLTLYGSAKASAAEAGDDERPYLLLAKRQLIKLRAKLAAEAKEQLPALESRLGAARAMEVSAPTEAAEIYEAVVRLYGKQAWAAPIVAAAKDRLNALESRN